MPDTLKAGAHSARFARSGDAALELVGRSSAIARIQDIVRRAAALDSCVLITAEPGCSAESIAREIHDCSRFAAAPYIVIECGGSDPAPLERLIFGSEGHGGHGSPARTDAPTDLECVSSGSRIAAAHGGTLFLQDISELPAALQARLARIVRDGEVRIDDTPVTTGFRLIASASSGIDGDVHGHRFRADLFRRLTAIRIDVPPLRDRSEDVPALATRLLEEVSAQRGVPPRTFTQAAIALLAALTWPGNLAELHDVIDRVVRETREDVIHIEHLLAAINLHRARAPFAPVGSLREARLRFEREYIAAVLQHHGWRMADAAQTLGIQRPNLYRKARQLGIPVTRLSE